MCPVCVSVLLSHTVLSELYQEELVTEDEVKRIEEEGEDLLFQLIAIQCTKPPQMVTGTTDFLDTFGYNKEARLLRGW